MEGLAAARTWAEQQFGSAALADRRRTRRLGPRLQATRRLTKLLHHVWRPAQRWLASQGMSSYLVAHGK